MDKNSQILIFNKDNSSIIFIIKEDIIIPDIINKFAMGKGLLPRKEFHITIIGLDTGRSLNKDIFEKVKAIAESFEWSFSLKNEFYYVNKTYFNLDDSEKRESIIQMIELPDLARFYLELNQLCNKEFAIPLPHITLYTNSSTKDNKFNGIGLYSKRDFENLLPERISLV